VVDRQDNFVPPPSDSAFYIELRAHDLGSVVDCHVQIGAQKRITLDRVGTTPGYVLYRSPRCFAVMDSRNNGATLPNPTGTDEYIPADASNDARAWILDEMPGNTLQPEPVRYSAGVRPVSYLSLVSTGDTNRGGVPHAPYLHIDIADDGSWPITVVTGGGLVATLTGWIQDAVADIHNPAAIEFEINGVVQTLTPQNEVASLGRPRAVRLNFSATVPVRFGVQGIRIVARNPLGGRMEKRFELTVDEATNNRASPSVFDVEVRPVGLYRAPELPELHYLMAAGTNLRSGTSAPPQITATIASLEPFPSGTAMTTLPMAMPHRPAAGMQYASGPFMTLRADRAGSLSAVPSDILVMPLGGRIEYETAALPNALGPIHLVTQVLRRATIYGIESWDGVANAWKVADVVRVGDEILLVVEAYGMGTHRFLMPVWK